MAQVISLTPFCVDVGRALALRGQKLLGHEDAPTLVPTLPALTLYMTIKELGLEEAAPLWLLATAEQRQTIVDIECWQGDEFSADELDAWLSPAFEAGPKALAEAFLRLDPELQVLFLQQSLRIIDHRALADLHGDQGDLEAAALEEVPEGASSVQTPGGHFTLVDFTREREVPPLAIIDALYGEPDGMQEAFRLLTAARTELASPLNEDALRFRSARMEEQGFCSPEEGARLFARPPAHPPRKIPPASPLAAANQPAPVALRPHVAKTIMPAAMAMVLRDPKPLFCCALDAIDNPTVLAAIEGEWMALVNAAIVGYAMRPSDLRGVTDAASWVRDALSLAIADVQAQAPDRPPADIVTTMPLMYLFQRAIACVRPLTEHARAAAQQPAVATWQAQTPAPEAGTPEGLARAFFDGLVSRRPLWQGNDANAPRSRQFWQTHDDIAQCMRTLDALVAKITDRG